MIDSFIHHRSASMAHTENTKTFHRHTMKWNIKAEHKKNIYTDRTPQSTGYTAQNEDDNVRTG